MVQLHELAQRSNVTRCQVDDFEDVIACFYVLFSRQFGAELAQPHFAEEIYPQSNWLVLTQLMVHKYISTCLSAEFRIALQLLTIQCSVPTFSYISIESLQDRSSPTLIDFSTATVGRYSQRSTFRVISFVPTGISQQGSFASFGPGRGA